MTDAIRIAAIHRYPVKGLSPERMTSAALAIGQTIAGDRRYAVENGPSGFDPAAPRYQPKIKYLMLMKNERLAALTTRFDEATSVLTIVEGGREAARGDLSTGAGRVAIEGFFRRFMPAELRGAPKVLEARGGTADFSFSDVAKKVISLINLASVADLERIIGRPLDPIRFRGNLHIEGLQPWAEFDLLGRVLEGASGARLKVVHRIERCAAINVDPTTGMRDLDLLRALMQRFGHMHCGVYAEVVAPGRISEGSRLVVTA